MTLTRIFGLALALLVAVSPAARAVDISNSYWQEVDGSNTTTPPNGWITNMLGSQVAPTGRA